jgi:hypothetical protein
VTGRRAFLEATAGAGAAIGMLAIAAARAQSGGATPAESLVVDRAIALKDVTGRIDHMAVDLGRGRLFVAELGNGTLDVVDLAGAKVIHRIEGLKEPQGVGYAPGADVLAVASGGDGSVRLFHAADLSPAATVSLGDDADNVRFDSRTSTLVVGYGSGGLAVIDPATARLVRRIRLPAHPEGFQLDPNSSRAFVNLPDARQIAVVDMEAGIQKASWPFPDARANFPMAFDETQAVVAVGFRNPPRLVLFDGNRGSPISSLPSCGDADDIFFDTRRRRAYVSCGEGVVNIWQQEANGYRGLGSIKTSSGARTSLFVPELDRLFVAVRAGFFGLGSGGAVLAFRPVD